MKTKRITALLLVFAMLLSFCPNVFADSKEQYGTLSVKWFSTEKTEPLTVMVKDNYVYVEASVLAEKLGYRFTSSDSTAAILSDSTTAILNDSLLRVIGFHAASKKIEYINGYGMTFNYNMPCKAILNENGFWVPFVYVLRLLDSGYLSSRSVISEPTKTALSNLFHISNEAQDYKFDVVNDLGDSKSRLELCKFVTELNGLLHLDPAYLLNSTVEIKYTEQLATLFCTQSQKEVRELADQISKAYDVLSDSGELAEIMESLSDESLDNLNATMKKFKDLMADKSTSSTEIDQMTKMLGKAIRNDSLINGTSTVVNELQSNFKSSDDISDYLSAFTIALNFYTYYQELENQDKTALNAMNGFTEYLNQNKPQYISSAGAWDLKNYVNNSQFQSGIIAKSIFSTLVNNMDAEIDLLSGGSIKNALFGTSGSLILFAWDLASNYIPALKNGLDNADYSTLAIYSQALQNETEQWYKNCLNDLYKNPNNKEVWSNYAKSAYAFLKMSYISRENGICIVNTYIEARNGKKDNKSKNEIASMKSYVSDMEKLNQSVINQASFYYTLSEDFDNNDNIAYFGMIPPVEAEVKENYSSYDSEIIKQVKNLSDDYDDINNPEKLYAEVLEQYRKAINNANIVNELNYVNTTLLIDYAFPIYYAFYDIDNNGVSELLIGTTKDSSLVDIYDIFTYDGVKPIVLIKNDVGFRTKCMIYTNSYIKIYNSAPEYSGYYTKYDFYNISTDGISLDLIVNLSIKEDVNSTQYYKDNNKISKNQFNKLINKYQDSDEISLSWIELKSKKNTSKDNSNNKSIYMSNINDIVQSHYWKSMIQSLYIYSFDSNNIYYYDITDEVFDKCINNNSISSDDLKDCEKIKIGTYMIDGNTLIIKGDFNVELQYVSYSSNGDYDIGLDLDNKLSANENFFYEVGWKSNGELGNAMYLQMIG